MPTVSEWKTKPIETGEWEKTVDGYVKWVKGRMVVDVADDLIKILDKHKVAYDWVSLRRRSFTESFALWPGPGGNTFVSLEEGGNEGYKVIVRWESKRSKMFGLPSDDNYDSSHMLTIKVNASTDDALETFGLIFRLLGANF